MECWSRVTQTAGRTAGPRDFHRGDRTLDKVPWEGVSAHESLAVVFLGCGETEHIGVGYVGEQNCSPPDGSQEGSGGKKGKGK